MVNQLAGETSPYLRQHKDNPVHWMPWGPEAFEQAKRENKPILLSVGYAACHWCHVMAHESFENDRIADQMNTLFVNIKVDREERPDLDGIYQTALQLMGEHGGWPLTMFLTPEGVPFFGGTYYPPEDRYGRRGFPDVLNRISQIYREEGDKVAKTGGQILDALKQLSQPEAGGMLSLDVINNAAQRLCRQTDPFFGGIGDAPKFPHAAGIETLWRAWLRTGMEPYRQAVIITLVRMCQGGIYDHLGGGFARYSVDQFWLVPHFEKMLYDNAVMVDVMTMVWRGTRKPLFEARVRETIGWVLREMTDPLGGFYGSLDADSEGEEGKFYVWDATEIDALLGSDAEAFKAAYDVSPHGNWEGKTILNRSEDEGFGEPETEALLARCRDKLLEARAGRIRPGLDDKVLADWNGLMIGALAEAAAVFEVPEWLTAAETAFAFIERAMSEPDSGRLFHSWCQGSARHPATLDDYGALARAAMRLYAVTGKQQYLERCLIWLDILDRHYWDNQAGGYFYSADDTSDLIARTKTGMDDATPAGNGMLVEVFARLALATGDGRYAARADHLVRTFSGDLKRAVLPLCTLLNGWEFGRGAAQVAVIGGTDDPARTDLANRSWRTPLPDRLVSIHEPETDLPDAHPAKGRKAEGGKATAYVCVGSTCSLPIGDADSLTARLVETIHEEARHVLPTP